MSEQTIIDISATSLHAVGNGMHLQEIRSAIPELEAACNAAMEYAEQFSDLCKLVGLKAGTDPAVVKTFITARCNERVAKTEQRAEQLSILFDEIT